MDVAMDWYLAVPLLFTVLAVVLASVFVRLRRGEGERAAERSREPAAAEPAREGEAASGAGPAAAEGPEDEGGRVPVEEVGAGEEGKEAAGEQREAVAEPGPAAEPSPATPENVPRQPPAENVPREQPAEPREPGHREDAESKIPPLGASSGSSLGHVEQAEEGRGHAALSSTAEEEDLDSEHEKLVVREPEDEDAADEMFSFKYSPGKLRGNQYKSMMTKEELEEEQSFLQSLKKGRTCPVTENKLLAHNFPAYTREINPYLAPPAPKPYPKTEDYMKLSLASS